MNSVETLKTQLFDAFLQLKTPCFWSFETLETASKEAQLDTNLPRILFKGDLDSALLELNSYIDTLLLKTFAPETLKTLRTHEKVQQALEKRMRFFSDHPQKTVAILKYASHPLRLSLLRKMQWSTLNSIWYFAGDTATDFNYYSKRLLLGYIYKATFLYWLKNRQHPIEKTLSFMNKRFKDVAMIPHLKTFISSSFQKINPFHK